jgi:hypothetical protein
LPTIHLVRLYLCQKSEPIIVGYRAVIIKDKQQVELRSRKNKDLTGMYPGIAAASLRLKAEQAVVDGEIVALELTGQSIVPGAPASGLASIPLGRRRDGRRDARDAVGEAGAGGAGAVRGVDGRGAAEARGVSWSPL